MAEIKVKERRVVGFVKVRPNKDKSVTFIVAGKEGQKFTLSETSDHAKTLLGAQRALVEYREGTKNPKIVFIIPNPSARLIREYQRDD